MARFFLLDPSLNRVGGHHFQQGGLLAEAAARQGWEPIVAAHRRVARGAWTVNCRLVPTFWRGCYAGYSVTERMSAERPLNPLRNCPQGAPDDLARSPTSWLGRIRAWWRLRRARSIARGTADALESFFGQFPPAEGDVVVMPTVTEFDLVGIVEYLARAPQACRIPWHLVFHFPLVSGPWVGDSVQQARLSAMREHFQEILSRVPDANLRFFATTPQLVEQYERLALARFDLAPPPVRSYPRDGRPGDGEVTRPLRTLCAGGFRSSKTRRVLDELVRELETDDFYGGRLQLWVQAPRARALARWSGGRRWLTVDPCGPSPPPDARLIHVPHPLPTSAYERLLAGADIGLLAYGDSRYSVLHSGVMAECLASGLPTVVPADSWMASELASETREADRPPGRTAGNPREFAEALRHLASDYSTYAASARLLAPAYAARHSAAAVLRGILSAASYP